VVKTTYLDDLIGQQAHSAKENPHQQQHWCGFAWFEWYPWTSWSAPPFLRILL